MIVIFSGADDVHSLAVQSEIRKRGRDAVIVDLRGYRENIAIEHVIGAGAQRVSVCLTQHGIDPVDVTGVWWRRVSRPAPVDDLDEATNAFLQKEIDTTLKGWLLSVTNVINPIDRATVANNKLLQLRIAQESGFCIPQTIVTTRKESILRFRDRLGAIVCKPMNGHAQAFIEARLVRPDEDIDDLIKNADLALYRAKREGRGCTASPPPLVWLESNPRESPGVARAGRRKRAS